MGLLVFCGELSNSVKTTRAVCPNINPIMHCEYVCDVDYAACYCQCICFRIAEDIVNEFVSFFVVNLLKKLFTCFVTIFLFSHFEIKTGDCIH